MTTEQDTATQEEAARRAAFEQAARQAHAQHAHQQRQAYEQHQAAMRAQMEADRWARITQQLINKSPRQQYACIVAVDLCGGFSKDGKIPWNYTADFKWFQQKTEGHICVMGRATYDDLVNHLGSKGDESILPGRKCFVVTSSPLPKDNAIAVKSISEVDKHLTFEDAENKTVFFIGGERIYSEGIAKANTLYITVVNKEVDADRFFPTNYTLKHFNMEQQFVNDKTPDLRFTIWKRK